MTFYDEYGHAIDMAADTLAGRSTLLFDAPKLHQPTPVLVQHDARIVGHLARWEHFPCTPPHSTLGYRAVTRPYEISGYLYRLARISLGGHADYGLGLSDAAAHYRAQPVAGWVAVGEDDHGIWVHGLMHHSFGRRTGGRDAMQVHLSGDWRALPTGTGMELVGLSYVGDQSDGPVRYAAT